MSEAPQGREHVSIEGVQYPLAQPAAAWKRRLKARLGGIVALLQPGRMRLLRAGQWPSERLSKLDKLLIAALVDEHERKGTLGALSGLHQTLWRTDQAVSVHAQAEERFQTWWVGRHSAIVAPLKEAMDTLAARGTPIEALCEIGCGSGSVLADIAQRLPELKQLIGLDLNQKQTEANRARFADQPRLRFECADATEWIAAQAPAHCAYLVNGGVLEYFSEAMLEALFTGIAAHKAPALFALVEPIASDYDLERETASRPYNFERSLGHNYPWWLGRTGWRVRWQERQVVGGANWLLVVAEAG
jgi:SAM-dependent methyltransferase